MPRDVRASQRSHGVVTASVAIGASTGGLSASHSLSAKKSLDPSAAFVVVRYSPEKVGPNARLEDGTVAEFCLDVADRKAAEPTLHDSQERLRQLARSEGEVRLQVRDEGCGFDPSKAEHAFGDTFGLFHARERLRHIGGELQIDAAEGKGSLFTIRVPASSEERFGSEFAALLAGFGSPHLFDREQPLRVILADDHQTVREGLARSLERDSRLQVVGEANDGAQVIEAVRRLQPHLVVMDVDMPEMNGIEATRRIKAEFPGVRVIGLSLHEESDMAEAMLEAGAENYFSKGAPSAELIAAILALPE